MRKAGRQSSSPAVLLISPHRWRPKCAPYSLEHLAHHLDAAGFEPLIVDFNFGREPRKRVHTILRQERPALCGITLRNFDAAFLTQSPIFFPLSIRRLIHDIRAWGGPPVIVGGISYSAAPAELLDYLGADYGLVGTAEGCLVELVRQFISGRSDLPAVPSLVWRDGNAIRANRAPPESHPLPAIRRSFFDHSKYYQPGLGNHYSWGSVETQRGCNRACVYCMEPCAKGRALRHKPPQAVIQELEELISQGIEWTWFTDSEFNLNLEVSKVLCDAIARRFGRRIKWGAYFVPTPFDPELAGLLEASGCQAAGFDVGHGEDEMLHRIGKDFDFAAIQRTANILRRTKLNIKYSVLLGAPGETEQTVRQALKKLARLGGIVEIGVGMRIYPGTPFARTAEALRPFHRHPALFGKVVNNDALLEPIYYLSPDMMDHYPGFIEELTAGEGRFLIPRLFPLSKQRFGDWRGIPAGYSRRRSNDLLLAAAGKRRKHATAGYIESR